MQFHVGLLSGWTGYACKMAPVRSLELAEGPSEPGRQTEGLNKEHHFGSVSIDNVMNQNEVPRADKGRSGVARATGFGIFKMGWMAWT